MDLDDSVKRCNTDQKDLLDRFDGCLCWRRVYTSGSVPTARHCHSAVIYSRSLFMFGGYSIDLSKRGEHRNDFYEYNFQSHLWSPVSTNRGEFQKSNSHEQGSISVQEPVPQQYRTQPPIQSRHLQSQAPSMRHSHSAVVYQHSMYIFGGMGANSEANNDLHKFDFERGLWSTIDARGDIPSARWGHTAVVNEDDGTMLLFGGYGITLLNDFYQFSFANSTWSKVKEFGSPPKPRKFHQAIYFKRCMYIIGGFGLSYNYNDFYRYSFESHLWITMSELPFERRGHSAVLYKDSIFVFGGFDHKQRNDVFMYSLDPTAKWTRLDLLFGTDRDIEEYLGEPIASQPTSIESPSSPPALRHFHTAVVYQDSMYIFGGHSMKHNMNDLFRFQIERKKDIFTSNDRNESSLSSHMKTLVNNPKFSDLRFIVEGETIYAHRSILYCRSEHFRAMIDNGMRESSEESIVFDDSISSDTFLSIMEYIYTGSVTRLSANNAVDLIVAADRFLLFELKDMVERYLILRIDVDNVMIFLQWSTQYLTPLLKRKCEEFLSKQDRKQ